MKCPYCDSEDWSRDDRRIIENWESDKYVHWYTGAVCMACGRKFWERVEYICTGSTLFSNDQFQARFEDAKKNGDDCWSE